MEGGRPRSEVVRGHVGPARCAQLPRLGVQAGPPSSLLTRSPPFSCCDTCRPTVNCILQWAVQKEAPWCPQCKKPFNYLYTHRLLDGTLSDAPCEESVCLLKRATWFVEHVKVGGAAPRPGLGQPVCGLSAGVCGQSTRGQ